MFDYYAIRENPLKGVGVYYTVGIIGEDKAKKIFVKTVPILKYIESIRKMPRGHIFLFCLPGGKK